MNADTAKIIFLILYGLSLKEVVNAILNSIFSHGIGNITKHGIESFLVRALFITLVVFLSVTCLIISLSITSTMDSPNFSSAFINILLVMLLSANPWLCDHIARFVFRIYEPIIEMEFREEKFKYVDILFPIIYLFLFGILYGTKTII